MSPTHSITELLWKPLYTRGGARMTPSQHMHLSTTGTRQNTVDKPCRGKLKQAPSLRNMGKPFLHSVEVAGVSRTSPGISTCHLIDISQEAGITASQGCKHQPSLIYKQQNWDSPWVTSSSSTIYSTPSFTDS